MKSLILGLWVAPLWVSAAEIPQGSHVLLRMVNSITTRTAQQGDQVYLRTASPIAVNGQIVVPVDSYVTGVVAHAKRSGKVRGRAELAIRLDTLTLPGGKAVKFTPRLASVDAGDSGQKVTGGRKRHPAIGGGGARCGEDRDSGGKRCVGRRAGGPKLEGRRNRSRDRQRSRRGVHAPHARP